MALLLSNVRCPSCGTQHDFGADADRLDADRDYEFVCPVTGKMASLRPLGDAKGAENWPQGAVRIKVKPT